ncbi:MAG TPA: alpha/beta hydrolase family protein, partial [Xanthobacteraceae bacterium]|nr:alpha/beta hydrolase family protein [Xanthobacteraceae bacterium]
MLGWQNFVGERERRLAAEGVPVKFAGEASVGLDHLRSGSAADELPQLLGSVSAALRDADAYFTGSPPPVFRRQGAMLAFDSPSAGECPSAGEGPSAGQGPSADQGSNSVARAQIFESGHRRRAVVLLPYWNAERAACRPFGTLLARCGITCIQLSLPYHDERRTIGVGFARELACENLGLTIRSNRQAVLDARACLTWLEREGYQRIGIIGVSIGASIASIVAAIDARVRVAALLLMADDFADAVWTGSATRHVRHSLERRFTRDEVRSAWSIISPASHAARLSARLDRLLIVSGALDTVFLPALTRNYVERLRSLGLHPTWIRYGCGHYTLGLP